MAVDTFQVDGDKVMVSTVFLGLDHSFGPRESTPVLFETMIFGGKYNEKMWRSTSVEESLGHHAEALSLLDDDIPITAGDIFSDIEEIN